MQIIKELNGINYKYNESVMLGRKSLSINGKQATSTGKKTFNLVDDDGKSQFYEIKGNFISGVRIVSGNSIIELCKNTWYEWILIMFPFLGLILGIFGGALGGGLTGFFGSLGAMLNACILRSSLKKPIKILLSVFAGVGAIFTGLLIYVLIVGELATAFPDLFKQ